MSELEQTEKSKDEQERKSIGFQITVNGVKFEVLSTVFGFGIEKGNKCPSSF